MFDFSLSSPSYWLMILTIFITSSITCKVFIFIFEMLGGVDEARTIAPIFIIILSLVIFIVPSFYFYQKKDDVSYLLNGLVPGVCVIAVAVLYLIYDIKREFRG